MVKKRCKKLQKKFGDTEKSATFAIPNETERFDKGSDGVEWYS